MGRESGGWGRGQNQPGLTAYKWESIWHWKPRTIHHSFQKRNHIMLNPKDKKPGVSRVRGRLVYLSKGSEAEKMGRPWP